MAKNKVIILPRAQQDIEKAYEYISQTLMNPKSADELIAIIQNKLRLLKDMPKMCPVVKLSGLTNTFRKCVINNFIIFYTINKETAEIQVARFYYGKKEY